jgi:hypothetical protein
MTIQHMTATGLSGPGRPVTGDHQNQNLFLFFAARAIRQVARRIPAFIPLAALLLASGCQTATQSLFTASGPNWHVQQGQAVWRPGRGMPEIGGDLVLAGDDSGRWLIQFDKTPMAIMSAQITSNRWLIKFPPRQMSFGGRGSGWTRFSWLYLPAALENKRLPNSMHFEHKPDGSWRLENSRTGESVEGFLSP